MYGSIATIYTDVSFIFDTNLMILLASLACIPSVRSFRFATHAEFVAWLNWLQLSSFSPSHPTHGYQDVYVNDVKTVSKSFGRVI